MLSQSWLVFPAHQTYWTISQLQFIELDSIWGREGGGGIMKRWPTQLHKEQSVNVRSPNQSNESYIKSVEMLGQV